MNFRRRGREITITLPRRRTVIRIVLVSALIILAVGGTVAFLTRPVEVFRDIRTPFEIDFTENIQEILLVYENGTLIKPIIGGHGGEAPMRAYFDAPVLFHFHAYAPFYNQSAIYSTVDGYVVNAWTTVGLNKLTFIITFENQTTITYEHFVQEGLMYTPSPTSPYFTTSPYYFHVKPGIILSTATYIGCFEGLQMEVKLSTLSVKVGDTIWIEVRLSGPKAWSVGLIGLTVTNSKGEKVYDIEYGLTHRTLGPIESPPQEDVRTLSWTAAKSPTANNVEVTPGIYTFIIKTSVNGRESSIRGTVEVTVYWTRQGNN